MPESGTPIFDPLTKRQHVIDFNHPNQPIYIGIDSASFGTSGTAVIFDAQGAPLDGGTIVISHSGRTRTLTVDPSTGKLSCP